MLSKEQRQQQKMIETDSIAAESEREEEVSALPEAIGGVNDQNMNVSQMKKSVTSNGSHQPLASSLKVKNRGFSAETFGALRLEDKRSALDVALGGLQSSGEKSSLKQKIAVSLAPKSVASRGGADDESNSGTLVKSERRDASRRLSIAKPITVPHKVPNSRGQTTLEIFKNANADDWSNQEDVEKHVAYYNENANFDNQNRSQNSEEIKSPAVDEGKKELNFKEMKGSTSFLLQVDLLSDVNAIDGMVEDPILSSVQKSKSDIIMFNTAKNIIIDAHFKDQEQSIADLLSKEEIN